MHSLSSPKQSSRVDAVLCASQFGQELFSFGGGSFKSGSKAESLMDTEDGNHIVFVATRDLLVIIEDSGVIFAQHVGAIRSCQPSIFCTLDVSFLSRRIPRGLSCVEPILPEAWTTSRQPS